MKTLPEISKQLNRAAALIPVPMIWLDPSLKVVGANASYLATLGTGKSVPLIGRAINDTLSGPEASAVAGRFKNVIAKAKPQICIENIRHPTNHTTRQFLSVRGPLRGRSEKPVGAIGISIELPAEVTALTTLAKKVAHDIQSPLTAILVMLNHCDELPDAKRSILKGAATSIKDMNSSLLKFGTGTALRSEEKVNLHIADFLQNLVRERQCQYQELPVDIALQITPSGRSAFVHAQPGQLGRAVSNIISNAVDALREREDGRVNILLDADKNGVMLTIEDNGAGMPAKLVQKIMHRVSFTVGKQQGHGIGLTQVWDMLDSNNGRLELKSDPGCGTVFKFIFTHEPEADEFNFSYYKTITDEKKIDGIEQLLINYFGRPIKTVESGLCLDY